MQTAHGKQLNRNSLASFRPLFQTLETPEVSMLSGRYRAEFVGPVWLRKAAGPLLAIGGLKGWWGKTFDGQGQGMNIINQGDKLLHTLPVSLTESTSPIDGQMCIAINYATDARWPWPWIVDEIRRLDDLTLLGLTMLKKVGWQKVAFPFLLHFVENQS